MANVILKALRSKQSELATLDEWAQRAGADDRVREKRSNLERQIDLLTQAASVERTAAEQWTIPRRKVLTKTEREELFQRRSRLMRRLLTEAGGRQVHVKQLAEELRRPLSTVKDYYSEQPNLRPAVCCWTNGIDHAHFTWKEGHGPDDETMTA